MSIFARLPLNKSKIKHVETCNDDRQSKIPTTCNIRKCARDCLSKESNGRTLSLGDCNNDNRQWLLKQAGLILISRPNFNFKRKLIVFEHRLYSNIFETKCSHVIATTTNDRQRQCIGDKMDKDINQSINQSIKPLVFNPNLPISNSAGILPTACECVL